MTFTTYENKNNPHVTIHRDDCKQIRKRGGEHKYRQGRYANHVTYQQAHEYAVGTGLPLKNCSFCKPI